MLCRGRAQADPNSVEAELPNGLIMGHAYSVTDVKLVEITAGGTKGKIPLVRVRNPWGNEVRLSHFPLSPLSYPLSYSHYLILTFLSSTLQQSSRQCSSMFTVHCSFSITK